MSRHGPVLHLTREEIAKMEKNTPTPTRRFGTDSSLDYPEQLEHIKRGCSKAITRLNAMLDTSSEASEVAEIVRALAAAQQIAIRASAGNGSGEPSDEELVRKAKA